MVVPIVPQFPITVFNAPIEELICAHDCRAYSPIKHSNTSALGAAHKIGDTNMKTTYYLCDKFGRYVAIDGDDSAILVAGNKTAESWITLEGAQFDAPAYSAALGTEVRVVAHCE